MKKILVTGGEGRFAKVLKNKTLKLLESYNTNPKNIIIFVLKFFIQQI